MTSPTPKIKGSPKHTDNARKIDDDNDNDDDDNAADDDDNDNRNNDDVGYNDHDNHTSGDDDDIDEVPDVRLLIVPLLSRSVLS